MSAKLKLFGDVAAVGRGARIHLKTVGYLNHDDTVVSWVKLNPAIRDRELTDREAKQLVVIEMESQSPREDLVNRLVNYMTSRDREELRAKLAKLFSKKR